MKWCTGQLLSNNSHGSGGPCKFLVKYHDDVESEASASKPLISIFPEMAYGNLAQPLVHHASTSFSLMGSFGTDIPEITTSHTGIGHKVLVLNPLTRAFRVLPDLPTQRMSSLLVSYCRVHRLQAYHYKGASHIHLRGFVI